MFRQMEEVRNETPHHDGSYRYSHSHNLKFLHSLFRAGLKPLKRFTPPPDNNRRVRSGNSQSEVDCTDSEDDDDDDDEEDDEEEAEEEEENEAVRRNGNNADYVRSSDKNVDEFLQQAQSAARAKQLRAKFERWETKEIMREQNNSSVLLYDGEDQSQVETAKE